jgi:RNA polymerase sigma-70 factor, ECF subfamily
VTIETSTYESAERAKGDNGLAAETKSPPVHPMRMDWFGPPPGGSGTAPESLSDSDLLAKIRGGDRGLFEVLMRRYNQRLYRAARAIVQNDVEVEDVLQQAYLNAFANLDRFEARSQVSTWLTRIVINEACAHRRQAHRAAVSPTGESGDASRRVLAAAASSLPSPEHQAYAGELQRLLEQAVDSLPEAYRLVFMLRDVEGLSTGESGIILGLGDDAVKTRLHRARAMIRRVVEERCGMAAARSFQFQAPRCDRVVATVLATLARTISE